MDVIDAIFAFKRFFPKIFRRDNDEYSESELAFQSEVINHLNDPKFRNVIIDPNTNEVDLQWSTFLWWVYIGDAPRINDSLHGFFWSASGNDNFSGMLDESNRFRRMVAEDIFVKAEYAKVKDYIKHINWVFHKTQNLPNVTVIGRGNVPERLHGLRQAKITVLDPKEELPVKYMFPDYGQRKRFRFIDSYEIFDVTNTKDYKMIGTQNVVIIDDYHITLDEDHLKEKILAASTYLTEHGRCLFDIPMYNYAEYRSYSDLYRIVRDFIPKTTSSPVIMNNVDVIDCYVHDVVRDLNQSEFLQKNGFKFEIEEIKLTAANHPNIANSIAARVYLKLSTHATT